MLVLVVLFFHLLTLGHAYNQTQQRLFDDIRNKYIKCVEESGGQADVFLDIFGQLTMQPSYNDSYDLFDNGSPYITCLEVAGNISAAVLQNNWGLQHGS